MRQDAASASQASCGRRTRENIMDRNGSVNVEEKDVLSHGSRILRRVIVMVIATAAAATIALAVPRPVAADGDGRRGCSNRTLRGDYGLLITGVRPAPPPANLESFVASTLRTYDGDGRFSQVDNVHGGATGASRDQQASGTYDVRADCSGTSVIFFGGAPFPVTTAFVIVDDGQEVQDAVMEPKPNVATAIHRRVRR
jgi:hypothetical protein